MSLRCSLLVAVLVLGVSLLVVGNVSLSPIVADVVSLFESRTFDDSFKEIWGNPHKLDTKGQHVELTLDRSSSGGGFVSQDRLYHGFFSAAIKLPGNYSAGVVTAFYTSNSDLYPNNHDEFDFEFLGVVPGTPYTLQTNIYGDGSTSTGREERLHLWFDPTEDYHHYSILWNQYHTLFFVDNIPIREMVNVPELGLQYPAKPQLLYTTIWDGSKWATQGGKYPVDYSLSPFKAFFKDLKVEGCVWNDMDKRPPCATPSGVLDKIDGPSYKTLSDDQKVAMHWVRNKYMWYSYCDDVKRYPTTLVDCPPREKGNVASASARRHHRRAIHGKHERILMEDPVMEDFEFSNLPASLRCPKL